MGVGGTAGRLEGEQDTAIPLRLGFGSVTVLSGCRTKLTKPRVNGTSSILPLHPVGV